MTDEWRPPDPEEPPPTAPSPQQQPASLLGRVVKSVFTPAVLQDGGHDAPMSPRGRILFWGTVSVLTAALVVVFVVTLATH